MKSDDAQPTEDKLPNKEKLTRGWRAFPSKSHPDNIYYFNFITGRTSWKCPVPPEDLDETSDFGSNLDSDNDSVLSLSEFYQDFGASQSESFGNTSCQARYRNVSPPPPLDGRFPSEVIEGSRKIPLKKNRNSASTQATDMFPQDTSGFYKKQEMPLVHNINMGHNIHLHLNLQTNDIPQASHIQMYRPNHCRDAASINQSTSGAQAYVTVKPMKSAQTSKTSYGRLIETHKKTNSCGNTEKIAPVPVPTYTAVPHFANRSKPATVTSASANVSAPVFDSQTAVAPRGREIARPTDAAKRARDKTPADTRLKRLRRDLETEAVSKPYLAGTTSLSSLQKNKPATVTSSSENVPAPTFKTPLAVSPPLQRGRQIAPTASPPLQRGRQISPTTSPPLQRDAPRTHDKTPAATRLIELRKEFSKESNKLKIQKLTAASNMNTARVDESASGKSSSSQSKFSIYSKTTVAMSRNSADHGSSPNSRKNSSSSMDQSSSGTPILPSENNSSTVTVPETTKNKKKKKNKNKTSENTSESDSGPAITPALNRVSGILDEKSGLNSVSRVTPPSLLGHEEPRTVLADIAGSSEAGAKQETVLKWLGENFQKQEAVDVEAALVPEAMEWESINQQVVGGRKQKRTSMLLREGELCIIWDTNALLDALSLLDKIKEKDFPNIGNVVNVIPWRAMLELDVLKKNCKNGFKARKAIAYIENQLQEKHPSIRGQTVFDHFEKTFPAKGADNDILHCCIQIINRGNKVILVSNDINIRNMGQINNIMCLPTNLLLTKLQRLDLERDFANPGDDGNEADDQFAVSDIICNEHAEPQDLPTIITDFKDTLTSVLSEILEAEMKRAFDDTWIKIVFRKPPWMLGDILVCFLKHRQAVFCETMYNFPEQAIKELCDFTKKPIKSVTNYEYLINIFKAAMNILETISVQGFQVTLDASVAKIKILYEKVDFLKESCETIGNETKNCTEVKPQTELMECLKRKHSDQTPEENAEVQNMQELDLRNRIKQCEESGDLVRNTLNRLHRYSMEFCTASRYFLGMSQEEPKTTFRFNSISDLRAELKTLIGCTEDISRSLKLVEVEKTKGRFTRTSKTLVNLYTQLMYSPAQGEKFIEEEITPEVVYSFCNNLRNQDALKTGWRSFYKCMLDLQSILMEAKKRATTS